MAKEVRRTPTSRSSSQNSDFQGIFAGHTKLYPSRGTCSGQFVERYGESWYRISNFDQLAPFLITLASIGDHWLFISSTGALTAGRRDANHALFPYVTDDKLHDAASHTGSVTLVRIDRSNRTMLWEPFNSGQRGLYRIERNLYKNAAGNKLLFEEFNRDLSLRFSYSWQCVNTFGFVRRARLESTWHLPMRISVLDGISNILPSGVSVELQRSRSTLVDAYKVSELEKQIGVFSLSSLIVDHPVPEEALRATLVWQNGPRPNSILLSTAQLDTYREGQQLSTEDSILGRRGAYLVERNLRLTKDRAVSWDLIADVDQHVGNLIELQTALEKSSTLVRKLRHQEQQDTTDLRKLIAGADGLQKTAQSIQDLRHYSNTLFNAMRGGIPLRGYHADKQNLIRFVSVRNRNLASSPYLEALEDSIDLSQLSPPEDPQLCRLIAEYLPLAYSRRHGDPSRPWNLFEIRTHNENGELLLDYSGNWRDLFQNWEALGRSYPRYYSAMLTAFVNASTADGYNPYRIGRSSVDWEIPDETDPWASIGYWGDHQLTYLLCLLEWAHAHDPDTLAQLMDLRIFSYVQIPYRLADYDQILADPKHSVEFDWDLHKKLSARVLETGSDGYLLQTPEEEPVLVTLAEKLLVPALTKLCAMVPGGGIWLNTQRPEWNDANNALAGWGCSLVTLFHLHRYLEFVGNLYQTAGKSYLVSPEVSGWLDEVQHALAVCGSVSNSSDRFEAMDALGSAACRYRATLYTQGLQKEPLSLDASALAGFCALAREAIQPTIQKSIREDGLVHSYTVFHSRPDKTIDVEALQLMLEGQVAALASGSLNTQDALNLLNALRNSPLYNNRHGSYLLYSDKKLPKFSLRNHISPNDVVRLSLVRKLIQNEDNRLISRNATGQYYFNPALVNAVELDNLMETLQNEGYKVTADSRSQILALYEKTFKHASFTGRSGRFFKYEGLGCVYWHIISKLLLAVQGTFWKAVDTNAPAGSRKALARHYYEIRNSLGGSQPPAKYGTFPQDAYSHTPGWGGAQQPGLTGQVKEDIICRWGELGIRISDGILSINPELLRKSEFCQKRELFSWYDIDGTQQSFQLSAGSLAFTYCQVLFVYHLSETPLLIIRGKDSAERPDLTLSHEESSALFGRTGAITRIDVHLTPGV
ncbi:MAG: hypothetical protein F4065_04445 [Rhodothermaceae bacterium]|nr:hypothetical protein [Rhodothermaceae bacterium]MXZ56927.1 hypothetical protein [Rhodothermaceae bacterium]MYB91473.1 hypothetical protein [Rhodothermaceae bacterium]MYD67000.1 hypothetical protein [Rhodothermaceae bacterium]MYG43584.1 hypothetical protein [Rhodothermaceae bacterium]